MMAIGGVYLAGGLPPRLVPQLQDGAIPLEERERRERRARVDADIAASVEFYEAEAEARELAHPEHTTACLAAAEEKERERRAAMDEYIAIATAEHPMDKAACAEVVRILTT